MKAAPMEIGAAKNASGGDENVLAFSVPLASGTEYRVSVSHNLPSCVTAGSFEARRLYSARRLLLTFLVWKWRPLGPDEFELPDDRSALAEDVRPVSSFLRGVRGPVVK